MNEQKLTVIIRNRNSILFNGLADSVSAENSSGVFDVLPQHANFISIIFGEIKVNTSGTISTYPVTQAILRVKEDIVTILIEH